MSLTAPVGFFEKAEMTRLWPPRMPALPPALELRERGDLELCAILLPF
jgi:hypothetical protein